MIRTLLMSAAIGGFIMSGALAQSNQQQSTKGLGGDAEKFIAMQTPDQWVFSKFKGTDVVGPNNEAIGSVNDMLFDKSGKIIGIVVGVGGFLGIGQKNVAMDMSAFQVVPTSSTGSSAPNSSKDPTNVTLKVAWTKDQLMQAPDFQYYKAPASTVGGGQQRPVSPAVPPAAPPARP